MIQSADIISKLPLTSIKFHQLQIFKGTKMADLLVSHPEDFVRFNMKEYLEFMVEYLEHLNPEIIVERIAGETPPRYAVDKSWGPRYDEVLREFEKLLEKRDSWQGKNFRKDN
jgi:radical SAM superfamily enzyme